MMPKLVPQYFCLVSGVGEGPEDKVAQDRAGRQAGVHDRNIHQVTSILPAGCQERDIDFIRQNSTPAQIMEVVDGKCITSIEGQLVSAGIAVTIPDDPEQIGFFAEIYEEVGILPDDIKRRVEKSSLQIFANEVGDQGFDPDQEWQDGKDRYRIGGKDVTLKSLVASGKGMGQGQYTCVYVGAILI